MELADKKSCTGCGACIYVCPKKCITFRIDENYDIAYPEINVDKCINCGRCRDICPALNPLERSEPYLAYAAWSSDVSERHTSASGGIATEIYKYAIAHNWAIVGATFYKNFKVGLKLANDIAAIEEFKNSKYVFSSTDHLFNDIEKQLKTGGKVVIIALPCQIAAVRKIFHNNLADLLLVDLVCHGTTPYSYLKQYIHHMEMQYGKKVATIIFRDPQKGTHQFVLSLYDSGGDCFYSNSAINTNDFYQYGYHEMITYRDNCYQCPYASRERVSDITLSDYKGLGSCMPCTFSKEKVSSVLINTKKGEEMMNLLLNTGQVVAEMRPVEEPIKGDKQLQHPSEKGYARFLFEKKYVRQRDFISVMRSVYRHAIIHKKILWAYHLPIRVINKMVRILHISRF